MKTYIRSTANISPQATFNTPMFLGEVTEYHDNRLTCIEPDYNEIISPKLNRRMSRLIKMSAASALTCLKKAGITSPDAIITGTAYGCLEDTGTFLTNLIEQNEEPLSPTAFVQSTHNTAGAQIALLIKCNYYNNTFASGGASFENTLLDAMMFLAEKKQTANVLVGGMDEITDASHTILSRAGLYKRNPVSNVSLFNTSSKGTVNGEGAAFFLLTNTPSENNLAYIEAVTTFYKPADIAETAEQIECFLSEQSLNASDIDLLVMGNNGDAKQDKIYTQLQQVLFDEVAAVKYKNLCGEYPTSTAFAMWMATNIINTNSIPAMLYHSGNVNEKINRVLIYNHYQNIYHSLILVSAC